MRQGRSRTITGHGRTATAQPGHSARAGAPQAAQRAPRNRSAAAVIQSTSAVFSEMTCAEIRSETTVDQRPTDKARMRSVLSFDQAPPAVWRHTRPD